MISLLGQLSETPTDEVWRLQTHWNLAPWLTVVLVSGAVALVAFCYIRERSPAGAAYRALLGLLRLVTIALILVMLSELLLAGSRSGRPRFAWLIDRSGSMAIEDPPASDAPDDSAGDSRLDQVKSVLLDDRARLLKEVAERYDTQVIVAGEGAEPLAGGPTDWPAAIEQISVNDAELTRLGDAISGLVQQASQPAPQSIVVWTDGRNTAGRNLSAAAESARRAGTRLFFVGVGSDKSPPDAALSDPLSDEVVFVEDLVSLGATLRAKGSIDAPLRLVLRRDGDPEVLAEQTIDPSKAGNALPVQLLHRPTEPGDYRYVMEVLPIDGERDTQNNSVSFDVQVRDANVSVLLAAGRPMYEYRYLKSLLERDSTISLKTYLQESDLEYATSDTTAINRLPIRQNGLRKFDVVVLMDLDPRLTPRSLWGELRRYVSADGGGLVLVAGPRYLPWAYRSIEEFRPLAPVDLDTTPISDRALGGSFQVRPTQIGFRTSSFQLGDNQGESQAIWRRLAPQYWYAELGEPKPAAQVLAEHPTTTTQAGRPAPLIVSQYFGAGQVLMHGIDSTYLWRRRVGDVYFARYWVQTLRRMAHGRLKRDKQGWELTVDRTEYQRGEAVRVRLRTPAGAAHQAAILLQPQSGPQRRVELAPSAVKPGVLEADLSDLPAGRYRALVAGADAGAVSATFEVVNPPGEFAQLERDTAGMRAAAERTGGRYLDLQEAESLPDLLPTPQRVPIESLPPVELWNRWWMLAGITGCLATEWILRKRKAML